MKAKQHTLIVLLVFVLAAGAALALLTHANQKAEQAASEAEDGSIPLLEGIVFTALVSGVLQCALFPRTALLGASGIVFMLIMLASLSGFSGGIPVTMLLVAALYLGQQVYDIVFVHDNVANFMHIVGGICGTGFGYFYALRPQKRRKASGAKPGLKFEKPSRHRSR